MENNSRVLAKNTLLLYFRQILIMAVSLYTARVVLATLGAEDYGIYSVVAGVVTMFVFLGGTMDSSSQRYFSYDLGKKDLKHLEITFSVTFRIYLLIALVVFLFFESAGLWFLNTKLVIPSNRLIAANWISQAAIISFLLTLITTPFMAIIIAHENMTVYSYVSIVEVALKLGIVFLLKYLPYDTLIVYGILLSLVSFINTAIYRLYCHKHYYLKMFLKDIALRKSCYERTSRGLSRPSDITLADFWGIQNVEMDMDDDKGTSLVLIHSDQTQKIWDIISKGLRVKQVSLDCVVKYNRSVAFSPIIPKQRTVFYLNLERRNFFYMIRKYGVTHFWTKAVRFAKRSVRYVLKMTIHKWARVEYNILCGSCAYKSLFVSKSHYKDIFLYNNSARRNAGRVFLNLHLKEVKNVI